MAAGAVGTPRAQVCTVSLAAPAQGTRLPRSRRRRPGWERSPGWKAGPRGRGGQSALGPPPGQGGPAVSASGAISSPLRPEGTQRARPEASRASRAAVQLHAPAPASHPRPPLPSSTPLVPRPLAPNSRPPRPLWPQRPLPWPRPGASKAGPAPLGGAEPPVAMAARVPACFAAPAPAPSLDAGSQPAARRPLVRLGRSLLRAPRLSAPGARSPRSAARAPCAPPGPGLRALRRRPSAPAALAVGHTRAKDEGLQWGGTQA